MDNKNILEEKEVKEIDIKKNKELLKKIKIIRILRIFGGLYLFIGIAAAVIIWNVNTYSINSNFSKTVQATTSEAMKLGGIILIQALFVFFIIKTICNLWTNKIIDNDN